MRTWLTWNPSVQNNKMHINIHKNEVKAFICAMTVMYKLVVGVFPRTEQNAGGWRSAEGPGWQREGRWREESRDGGDGGKPRSVLHCSLFSRVEESALQGCSYMLTECCLIFIQTSPEEGKQEKKADQPPQAKKAKVKTKVLDLPIENNPQWQLAIEMLNLFVENEVKFWKFVCYASIVWVF